ncbi:MAG: hypothetical protein KDJ43_07700 [Rhizobiaceae bacterium]|nr:hypothetical protein [Rhizobiaceae bacterium]MCC0044524.1 hypothetical protein [Brucellaceae bacterium]
MAEASDKWMSWLICFARVPKMQRLRFRVVIQAAFPQSAAQSSRTSADAASKPR